MAGIRKSGQLYQDKKGRTREVRSKKKPMETNINEVEINGRTYVLKDIAPLAPILENMVIVRSEMAGVFYGQLTSHQLAHGTVTMVNARRVWYWSGAASLSQLAVDGTCKPKECKFPTPVPFITIAKVIEVIPMTQKAVESLNGVAIWKQ